MSRYSNSKTSKKSHNSNPVWEIVEEPYSPAAANIRSRNSASNRSLTFSQDGKAKSPENSRYTTENAEEDDE